MTTYEQLHDRLEALYLRLLADISDRELCRVAWWKAREAMILEHGWTVETFYAEMDRRRREAP